MLTSHNCVVSFLWVNGFADQELKVGGNGSLSYLHEARRLLQTMYILVSVALQSQMRRCKVFGCEALSRAEQEDLCELY